MPPDGGLAGSPLAGRPRPSAPAQRRRVDLGLAILHALSEPGRRHSCAGITAWCGCSAENTQGIEARALAKLRRLLLRAGVDRESVGALFADGTSDARWTPRHGEA